jgi:sec-independent protein translocase protein TatA
LTKRPKGPPERAAGKTPSCPKPTPAKLWPVIGDILQPTHLLFVLVVALLVLGPKRLPEVGRSLGKGLRDFKSALSGDEQPNNEVLSQSSADSTTPAADRTEHVG